MMMMDDDDDDDDYFCLSINSNFDLILLPGTLFKADDLPTCGEVSLGEIERKEVNASMLPDIYPLGIYPPDKYPRHIPPWTNTPRIYTPGHTHTLNAID